MPITVDPGAIKQGVNDSNKKQSVLPGVGFSDFLSAAGATGSQYVAQNVGYQPALVAQAAVTGLAGTASSMTAANAGPYGGAGLLGTNGAFSGGGYNYYGSQFNAGVGYAGPGGSVGVNSTIPGGTSPTGAPSQDYQEKQALFQQMNDANWEMLLAQVTVNDISRDYQARSNILKTKSDAEQNSVRNMRG